MTITLSPKTETRLREKAEREGRDPSTVADAMLARYFHWEAQADTEEMEAIRQGLEAYDSGRVRLFSEFAAEMRAKYHLPTHLSDQDLIAPK